MNEAIKLEVIVKEKEGHKLEFETELDNQVIVLKLDNNEICRLDWSSLREGVDRMKEIWPKKETKK